MTFSAPMRLATRHESIAVFPAPTTATRLLLKSTPVCGKRLVWYHLPLNCSRPLNCGMLVCDRLPTAAMR